jgi:hypothetical protein
MQKTKESLIDNVHKKIMLSDKINEPLLDIDKCSLSKLVNLLQKFANDPLMACRLHPVGNPKRKV